MSKGITSEVRIRFSAVKHEFLVEFYEDGFMKNWEVVIDTKEIQQLLTDFYFTT